MPTPKGEHGRRRGDAEGIRGQVRLSMLCVFQGKVVQNLEKVSRTPGYGRSLLWRELFQVSASQDIYLIAQSMLNKEPSDD